MNSEETKDDSKADNSLPEGVREVQRLANIRRKSVLENSDDDADSGRGGGFSFAHATVFGLAILALLVGAYIVFTTLANQIDFEQDIAGTETATDAQLGVEGGAFKNQFEHDGATKDSQDAAPKADVTRQQDKTIAQAIIAPRVPFSTKLTYIAFGSCLSQRHPQPIWDEVLALNPRPQMFLMMGDNVYGDVKSPELSRLSDAYRKQANHPEFSKVRRQIPMLATWDDHDYGRNDAGGEFEWRAGAEKLFRDFWKLPIPTYPDGGLYYAQTYGPADARVQIIFLDTRSHRSKFKRRVEGEEYLTWGRYEPDYDPTKTMLGEAQWNWFEEQLEEPAQLRIILSSVQVWSNGHGFEGWRNFPNERVAFRQLISSSKSNGVILLSGDRHMGAIYALSVGDNKLVPEVTSSSLNRSYGPSRDIRSIELKSDLHHVENFGTMQIDWAERRIVISLHGLNGKTLEEKSYSFADLGL